MVHLCMGEGRTVVHSFSNTMTHQHTHNTEGDKKIQLMQDHGPESFQLFQGNNSWYQLWRCKDISHFPNFGM
jgi:hypothetical protein